MNKNLQNVGKLCFLNKLLSKKMKFYYTLMRKPQKLIMWKRENYFRKTHHFRPSIAKINSAKTYTHKNLCRKGIVTPVRAKNYSNLGGKLCGATKNLNFRGNNCLRILFFPYLTPKLQNKISRNSPLHLKLQSIIPKNLGQCQKCQNFNKNMK